MKRYILLLFVRICMAEELAPTDTQSRGASASTVINAATGALTDESKGNLFGQAVNNLAGSTDLGDVPAGLCKTVPSVGDPEWYQALTGKTGKEKSPTTPECTDYCQTFQPNGFRPSLDSLAKYGSYLTKIPESVRPWVTRVIAALLMNKAQKPTAEVEKARGEFLKGTGCVFNLWDAILKEVREEQACQRGSQCAVCQKASVAIRQACRFTDAIMTCGEQFGLSFKDPSVVALKTACGVGIKGQRSILVEGCKRACVNSLGAAAPIAGVKDVKGPDGQSEKGIECCMCRREKWEKGTFYSDSLGMDFYNGPISDTKAKVSECEGREGKKIEDGKSKNGRTIFYKYSGCKRQTYIVGGEPASGSYYCPTDHAFHMHGEKIFSGQKRSSPHAFHMHGEKIFSGQNRANTEARQRAEDEGRERSLASPGFGASGGRSHD